MKSDLESTPFKQACCQYDFPRLVDSHKDAAQQEAALNASRQGWNITRRASLPSSFLPLTRFGQDGSAGSWQISTTLAVRDAVTELTWLTAELIQKLQCAAITGLKVESILSDYGCLGWNVLAFLCNILKKVVWNAVLLFMFRAWQFEAEIHYNYDDSLLISKSNGIHRQKMLTSTTQTGC